MAAWYWSTARSGAIETFGTLRCGYRWRQSRRPIESTSCCVKNAPAPRSGHMCLAAAIHDCAPARCSTVMHHCHARWPPCSADWRMHGTQIPDTHIDSKLSAITG